jgi:hypothetical protein
MTDKEVHYFGIPTAGNVERKRTTEVQPFSFEERDRQLLKKKEETIRKVRFKSCGLTIDSEMVSVISLNFKVHYLHLIQQIKLMTMFFHL